MSKVKKTKSVENRPGRGRKRKLSKSQQRAVVKRAKRDKDAPEIASSMSKKIGKPISETLIQRTLTASGLKYLVVEEETKLTESQKERRVKFANTANTIGTLSYLRTKKPSHLEVERRKNVG